MNPSPITPNIAGFLQEIRIPIRLACNSQAGWPVVISLWYLHEAGNLYCATVEDARVVSYLSQNPRCAFEVAADEPPYCGVRGQARAEIDRSRGEEILRRLLLRYLGGTDNSLAQWLLSRADQEVAIVLRPINVHTWNYSQRMRDLPRSTEKLCP
jgi:nitroimidazol reductase NimA-like FMN-containing flavoprotein (pyridoxamine 5'-phosphate oxidase superfamily)